MTGPDHVAGEDVTSFGDVLAEAAPVVKRARICLRGDLVDELDRLEIEFAQAKVLDDNENRTPEAPALAERIVQLVEQTRQFEREFAFQAIGRQAWRDLAAEHGPRPEDKEKGGDFNAETFPAAAMGASCIKPKGANEAGFLELRDSPAMGDVQWNRLWTACLAANTRGSDIPLSVAAFALARGTEPSSEQRGTTASPEASF